MTFLAAFSYRYKAALSLFALGVGACFLPPPISSQAQSTSEQRHTPHQAPHSSTAAKSDKPFAFTVRSVEVEKLPDGSNGPFYVVEGTTINAWRFALSCPDHPPYSTAKYHTDEERAEREKQYRDLEQYRKLASSLTTLASLKREGNFESVTLYTLLLQRVDQVELTMRAAQGDEAAKKIVESLGERRREWSEKEPGTFTEALAECAVINRIENAREMLSVAVTSSDLARFKDGQGYKVDATIGNESLTLGCVEAAKGALACQSIPPGQYRATRIGSQLRLYDSTLGLLGIFRILSEQPSN